MIDKDAIKDNIIKRIKRCIVGDKKIDEYKSHDMITIKCDKCPHRFSIRKTNLISGHWCSYCCRRKKLCSDESCAYCFNNSFASTCPELSNPNNVGFIWSDKNKTSARNICKFSNKSVILLCTICNHESVLQIRYYTKYKNKCRFCSSVHAKVCGRKECKYCWNRSFATDVLAKYMIGSPWMYTKYSKKICMFKCDKCNGIFQRTICNMNRICRCPLCYEPL